jgi:hypothetical protein
MESDTALNGLLESLKGRLQLKNLPSNNNEAKAKLTRFGLTYNRIDACRKNCIIYYGDKASMLSCFECGEPRYKPEKGKTPWKVLRHFPIIPCILKSFKSHERAPLFNGYKDPTSQDGLWRVPSDSLAWKHINNEIDPNFEGLYLGAAIDGINAYKSLPTKWSTWAVTVLNYNLPPHLITKPFHMMLSLIIPGKKQVEDIDVFLEPLIDELQMLWKGVPAIDVSKPIGKLHLPHMYLVNYDMFLSTITYHFIQTISSISNNPNLKYLKYY